MRSSNLAVIYFALTAICIMAMYTTPLDNLLGVFAITLTTIYVFTKAMDHLNDHLNEK
jgi:hypothetical protein